MEDKIISKKYFYIEFELASALTIGGKSSGLTDKDIVKNSRGEPYIPATALAGIYRSLFSEKEKELYFGYMQNETDIEGDSKLIIYDANIKNNNYRISKRDGVKLDEWKTAEKGAKFNFEILEPGAVFVTFIEENKYTKEQAAGDMIANAWKKNHIVLGGKTSRGYGETRHIKIQALEFPFGQAHQKDMQEWLNFCIYKDEMWEKYKEIYKSDIFDIKQESRTDRFCMELYLKQMSPITIRTYTIEKNQDGTELNYEQIIYVRDSKGERKEIPVIPGTSWAGAFKHHMIRIEPSCEKLFGEDAKRKSDISFGESEIEGANSKVVTRNAIDRLTGGTVDGSLFTEKMYYGGTTVLKITFKDTNAENTAFVRALAASVSDLHMGILSIGGETSIGHGLFYLTEIKYQGNSILDNKFQLGKYHQFSESMQTLAEEAEKIYTCITNKVCIKTGGNENVYVG